MGFFMRKGSGAKILVAASVAGSSPTRAEINGAIDLSEQLTGSAGFTFNSSVLEVPVLAHRRNPQIPGEDTIADSSLTFADRNDLHTIRQAMPKDEEFTLILMPYGDVPGARCEVWPAQSMGVNDEWDMSATPAKFAVPLAITADPNQNAIIPAA